MDLAAAPKHFIDRFVSRWRLFLWGRLFFFLNLLFVLLFSAFFLNVRCRLKNIFWVGRTLSHSRFDTTVIIFYQSERESVRSSVKVILQIRLVLYQSYLENNLYTWPTPRDSFDQKLANIANIGTFSIKRIARAFAQA